MRIRFKCTCGSTLIVGADKAGKTGKCPECTRTVTVPVPSEAVSVGATGESVSVATGDSPARQIADSATSSSQPPKEAKESRVCDVKCEDCGATFQKIRWAPGNRCRICRSTSFFPVVVVEKPAVAVPAREEAAPVALSIADVRFGRIARWARFVREAQVAECRRIQQLHSRGGEPIPFIGKMMQDKSYLNEPQVNAILKVQSQTRSAKDEAHFGQITITNNMLTHEQRNECVRIREEQGKAEGSPPLLCEVMIDKGYLDERQVGDILQAQKQHNRGLLYELEDVLSEESADNVIEKIKHMHKAGWRNNPLIAGVLGVVCVLVFVVAFKQICAPTIPVGDLGIVDVLCTSCNEKYQDVPTGAPLTCKSCGERSVYYLMNCKFCGEEFPFSEKDIREGGLVCTKCNKPQR